MGTKQNNHDLRIVEERREEPDLRMLAKVLLTFVINQQLEATTADDPEELAS